MKVNAEQILIMRRQVLESIRDNINYEIRKVEDMIIQVLEKKK